MTDTNIQHQIMDELEVVRDFDAADEAERRITFLANYLRSSGLAGYVLGISGGVDSTTGGRLAQLACERIRRDGGEATFIAMRLPYGVQADEADAQTALAFISPDETITVNVQPAADAMWAQVSEAGITTASVESEDYHQGNVKARQRMVAQFTVAGARRMLVIGTDHAAEALVGFYTKFGDGAADITPLFGLSKRQVRAIAAHLGAPQELVNKVPTADLEDGKPLLPDEKALGVSYASIDAYLAGEPIPADDEATILRWHRMTAHKRALPVTVAGWEGPA